MNITPYKKKDGRTYYMFHAYIGVDEKTGKEKRVCRRGFESKKAAQIAYLELTQSDIEKEKERSKMTYRDVYELWLEEYRTQVKESTLIGNIARFRYHILPYLGNHLISKITHDDMQKIMSEWAQKTKEPKKMKTAANFIFRYAMIHGIIEKSPLEFVKAPKKQELEKFDNYLDFDQLKCFVEAAKRILPELWYVFFYLLAFTGMRRGEALALEWSDIDFENSTIQINKTLSRALEKVMVTTPKTNTSNRVISMGEALSKILLDYKNNCTSDTLVFPNTLGEYNSLSTPNYKIAHLCKKAGIKHISPHGLRHTHCCLLFEAGASIAQVQQRLGHKDPSITLGIYNHVTKQKEKESAVLFEIAFENTHKPQSKPQSEKETKT